MTCKSKPTHRWSLAKQFDFWIKKSRTCEVRQESLTSKSNELTHVKHGNVVWLGSKSSTHVKFQKLVWLRCQETWSSETCVFVSLCVFLYIYIYRYILVCVSLYLCVPVSMSLSLSVLAEGRYLGADGGIGGLDQTWSTQTVNILLKFISFLRIFSIFNSCQLLSTCCSVSHYYCYKTTLRSKAETNADVEFVLNSTWATSCWIGLVLRPWRSDLRFQHTLFNIEFNIEFRPVLLNRIFVDVAIQFKLFFVLWWNIWKAQWAYVYNQVDQFCSRHHVQIP